MNAPRQKPMPLPFAEAFAAFSEQHAGDPAWLVGRRRQAFTAYTRTGLPSRTDEAWRYTSLRRINEGRFHAAAGHGVAREQLTPYVHAEDVTLVLVNGLLAPELSDVAKVPSGVSLTPLAAALAKSGGAAERLLRRYEDDGHGFHLLNEAFLSGGLILEWAPKAVSKQRFHILHVSTEAGGAAFSRCLFALAAGAAGEVAETYIGITAPGAAPYFVSATSDIDLAAGAELSHSRAQIEGATALHIGRLRAELAAEAKLHTFSFSAGAQLARVDLDIALCGQASDVTLDGLYLVRDTQHVDHHTSVDHRVPSAKSSQLYKGILAESGRAVFNGKVCVRRDAQLTQAYQLNRNLLLSSEAEIDTKPELQIDADDVKCSHGASIGQLSDDQLFYLTSRGLRPDEARRLLAEAFADELLLKAPASRAWLRPLTRGYFK